ncbi:MAG TPA: M23 family metallopeptidase [Gammaproteobacteria bacterium]|nr:M23 family metallopeptidase [Gammaproteobacteria bacterium]
MNDYYRSSALLAFVLLTLSSLLGWAGHAEAAQNSHAAEKKSQVTLINRGTDSQPVFDVRNNYDGPIEFELSAGEFVNMKSEPALPVRKVIPAKTTIHLCRLMQISAHEPWSYTYSTRYVLGKPGVRQLTGKPYGLPFGEVQQFVISQGFEGRRSHQTPATRYAIDIDMPQGTEVLAMRSGRVMEITRARLNNDKKSVPVLQIRILHQDGTIGLYAYLKKGSIAVHEGQRVQRGQLIAASGPSYKKNVKPHLHFAVQRNAGMRLESIPFQIISFSGSGITPKAGMTLRHSPY